MSGGHFSSAEYKLINIAEQIEEYVELHGSIHSQTVIEKFNQVSKELKILKEKVRTIDLLIEGDVGDETFLERFENILED
jgi:hypothetical protein